MEVLSVSQHAQQFSQNQNSIKSQKYISNAFLDCLHSIVLCLKFSEEFLYLNNYGFGVADPRDIIVLFNKAELFTILQTFKCIKV